MSHQHEHPKSTEKKEADHQIIIVGCGRLGAELALALCRKQENVTIIDANARAFEKLGPDFKGRTVQGEAIDLEVLKRAGIDYTHGFAAVTSSDSVNIVTSRAARDIFQVEHVVARVYNPRKSMIYEKLGLQTIGTSSWGAQRFAQILLHPDLRNVGSAGNGDIQTYEFNVPEEWAGRSIADLVPLDTAIPAAITRGGKTTLPTPSTKLEEQDILQVTATSEGASVLRRQLKYGLEKK
jgi:trk system potassium uptake protein